jgi:hypothetical protein
MSLTLEKMLEALMSVRIKGPTPNAIWFVDREDEYKQFIDSCIEALPVEDRATIISSDLQSFSGLPVHNWKFEHLAYKVTSLVNEGYDTKHILKAFPVLQPGIWIVTTDGRCFAPAQLNALWAMEVEQ